MTHSVQFPRSLFNQGSPTGATTRRQQRADEEITHRITKGTKRTFSEISESDNEEAPPIIVEAVATQGQNAMMRRLEPMVEILRDDAFPLGVEARNQFQLRQVRELQDMGLIDKDVLMKDDSEDETCGVELKRTQYKIIDEIAKKKSGRVAAQFFELYQLLESIRLTKKPQGEVILELASEILNLLPDIDESEAGDLEPEEQFVKLAEQLLSKLPIGEDGGHARELAVKLQQAVEADDSDEKIENTERMEAENLVVKRMGYLLFVAHHNIHLAAGCATSPSFEDALDQLSEAVSEISEQTMLRISEHTTRHTHVGMQDPQEATFHKMSVEMAKLILLPDGAINFGIIDEVSEVLIPNDLKDTIAIKNLKSVLDELQTNPLVWKTIAEVKAPVDKGNPSITAIRDCLEISPLEEISRRHAQLFVLSGILGHLRQAKAGTCFATACIIKALYYHLNYFVGDLKEITEKGYVTRLMFSEERKFPYHLRHSKEFLDLQLEVTDTAKLISTRPYELIPDHSHRWKGPKKGAYLFESPGIVAACQAIGITNEKETLISLLPQLGPKFAVNDLLIRLAHDAYEKQENVRYSFRSQEKFSEEQLLIKAQFAFGAQTSHPLHRAYEQITASMVNYFGGQYAMPSWVHSTLVEVLEKSDKGYPPAFQRKYKALLAEIFLPMIIRMRYRYNPYIENTKKLFDDGNYGTSSSLFYGYELCDGGLPNDFEYSTALHDRFNKDTAYILLERFKEYPSPHNWKVIKDEEKFKEFLQKIISETAEHLKMEKTNEEQNLWDQVAGKMCADINKPEFTKEMIRLLLGRDSSQKKELQKNEFTVQTTPWRFMWGGDFNAVMKTYFGFTKSPSKLKKYNGSPKEVLSKYINFIKNQPDHIKEDFGEGQSQLLVTAPVHAFLLLPCSESFKRAWTSELSTNEYVARYVERPGRAIASSRLNARTRNQLIDFVANNQWVTRAKEKDDWERQQLTNTSKQAFDQRIANTPGLLHMSLDVFENEISQIVALSRAADPNIGKRNEPWERRFRTVLHNFVKKLVPNARRHGQLIRQSVAKTLLEFARDRVDTVALSPTATAKFRTLMGQVPANLSATDFRQEVVKAAYLVHTDDMCGDDPGWKATLCEYLDDKLFTLLPKISQERLIASGIITHDPNWKDGVYDYRCIFLVNPGTGNIEMARYVPDLKKIRFESQSDWFPRKTNGHAYWDFPENYRAWKGEPIFNVKKYMDV